MIDVGSIQKALVEAGLDGWLFYQFKGQDPAATRLLHLTPGRMGTRRWFYWLPACGEPVRIVHAIEAAALDEVPGEKSVYVGWRQLEERLAGLLGSTRRIAMQYSPGAAVPTISRVDAGTVEMVRACGPEVVSSADLVQLFEAVLDPAQEATHFEAARILPAIIDESFREVAAALRRGRPLSERELQERILRAYEAHDLVADHPPIVAVDAHSADPHYEVPESGSATIREGTFLLLDIWAKKRSARSIYADITWTGYVGTAVPEPMARVFDIVRRARVTAQDFVAAAFAEGRPVRGCEADQVCRDVVEKAGYGPRFLHRTGHNIGEEVHGDGANLDNLETRDERLLLRRTCFSVEPGIYLDAFGVRSEIDMYVHADGRAVVTGRQQDAVVPILA